MGGSERFDACHLVAHATDARAGANRLSGVVKKISGSSPLQRLRAGTYYRRMRDRQARTGAKYQQYQEVPQCNWA